MRTPLYTGHFPIYVPKVSTIERFHCIREWEPLCLTTTTVGMMTGAIPFLSSSLPSSSDVDDVHDMMDDIQEQNEIAEEITSALSTPIGFNQEIDDVSHRTCSSM